MILGIDEVGRGPWAGPLVVGAVVLGEANIPGLTDSKKLSKKRREVLDVLIREQAAGFGLGWVSAQELDEIGLSESLKLATRRAVEQIKTPYSEIIIDGTVNFLKETGKGRYVTTMKKADLLIPAVSAASIIAKVARDAFMAQQDNLYPGYDFASHVGYGTAKHQAAIAALGVTPLHRLSFAPLAHYRADQPRDVTASEKAVKTTKMIGDTAEAAAAAYLESDGYKTVARNWKTKWCEIDIIAEKADVLYFVEVKYRRHTSQGGGLAAITKKKLGQMRFAAESYLAIHHLAARDVRLAVMAATGEPPIVETLLVLE